jgi:hypothetical protein
MMSYRLFILMLVLGFQAAGVFAEGRWEGTGFAADFRQTFTDTDQDEQSGRFFLDREGMRMEMTEEGRDVVSIMRFKENDMLMVMPDAKRYMIMPFSMLGQGGAATLEGKFAGACAEYAVKNRVGSEKINGRDTDKWRCEQSTNDEPDADIWFDESIGAPVLIVDDEGSRFEITGIVEGDQPAELFQPPADFRPMSMQDMMQMGNDG